MDTLVSQVLPSFSTSSGFRSVQWVLHAQMVASKIAVLHSAKRLVPILLTGAVCCALRRAKITEGERVVPPVVALHGRFLCTNLRRRSISKETWPPHSLKPATAEAVRWPRLFVKYLPRAKL